MPGESFRVELRIDEAKLREVQQKLSGIGNGAPRALSSAINKVLAQGRTLIKREITSTVNLSQKAVLRALRVRKASPSNLAGDIGVGRQPIPLGEYKPRQTKQGVSVKVRKDRGTEIIKGAFIATMPSGHTGVYKRAPGWKHKKVMGKNGPHWSGLPIKQLYGPTAVGVLGGKPGLLENVTGQLNAKLNTVIDSQVQWLLDKGQPKPEAASDGQ